MTRNKGFTLIEMIILIIIVMIVVSIPLSALDALRESEIPQAVFSETIIPLEIR